MGVFTEGERRAFAPPEKVSPSEWAERYAYLPAHKRGTGKYRSALFNFNCEIADAIDDPNVSKVVVIKSARVGYTTTVANQIAWIADQRPSPVMLVMPNEAHGGKLINDDILPTLRGTPKVAGLLLEGKDGSTKDTIRFVGNTVRLGWSGSPASMKSWSIRYVFMDEVDSFAAFDGDEADPVSLAEARTIDWEDMGKVVMGSTPTTRKGHIFRAYEACGDKRRYHVPCPHCSEYQTLDFTNVKFDAPEIKAIEDKAKRADYVDTHRLAYYECSFCKERIEDRHKPKMIAGGLWLSEGQTIDRYGRVYGARPKAKTVGYHISALYNPFVTFSRLAAEFIRSQGDMGRMMNFRNSWLGECFEEVTSSVTVEVLRDQLEGAPAGGAVPKWAGLLAMSADVHKSKGLYWLLRAWGKEKSQLVACGKADTFAQLLDILNQPYQIAGTPEVMVPRVCVVDSRYRTDEVYQFASWDQRVVCIKGGNNFSAVPIDNGSAVGPGNQVRVRTINTHYFKDALANLRAQKRHLLSKAADDEYLRHQAAEHKVYDPKRRMDVWQEVSVGAQNHYLDCEVYSVVAAELFRVHELPDAEAMERRVDELVKEKQRLQQQQQQQPQQGGMPRQGNTSSWLNVGGKKWM